MIALNKYKYVWVFSLPESKHYLIMSEMSIIIDAEDSLCFDATEW